VAALDEPLLTGGERFPVKARKERLDQPGKLRIGEKLHADDGPQDAFRLAVQVDFQPDRVNGGCPALQMRGEPGGLGWLPGAEGEIDRAGFRGQTNLDGCQEVSRQSPGQPAQPFRALGVEERLAEMRVEDGQPVVTGQGRLRAL
jgi:hypothetical protein